MRVDAEKNRDRLLEVARDLLKEGGADTSLREIARTAGVGLGTLHRHFPTRETLLEALLRASFDDLAVRAEQLTTAPSPGEALVAWLRAIVAVAHDYSGAIRTMVAAIEDEGSALHASCTAMKAAGTRLLVRAQAQGQARADIDGADLFALVGALAWVTDQPALAPRADRILGLVADAVRIRNPESAGG